MYFAWPYCSEQGAQRDLGENIEKIYDRDDERNFHQFKWKA